jgi:hypothetical protein
MICPDAVIAMDYESAPDDLEILEVLNFHVDDSGMSFSLNWALLKDFSKFLQGTALIDVIQALRWMIVIDSQAVVDNDIDRYLVVRRPGALHHTGRPCVLPGNPLLPPEDSNTDGRRKQSSSEMQNQAVACMYLGCTG